MVEITSMASALFQPDFVGAPGDFGAQIRGFRRGGGVFCFLSRSVFHCSVPFYCPVTSTILKRASFRIIRAQASAAFTSGTVSIIGRIY